MNCIETDTLLSVAEAFGELPERKLAHVAQCASCRAMLNDLGLLRTALTPESLSADEIDRVTPSIPLLDRERRHEERTLAALFVAHFLVVSFTLAMCLTIIGGFGLDMFEQTGVLFAWPKETPLAFAVGLLIAWRAYQSERARLGRPSNGHAKSPMAA
ncbi:MAG: hypothetical protein WEE89_11910 [Gemmatimonadota bacterium]